MFRTRFATFFRAPDDETGSGAPQDEDRDDQPLDTSDTDPDAQADKGADPNDIESDPIEDFFANADDDEDDWRGEDGPDLDTKSGQDKAADKSKTKEADAADADKADAPEAAKDKDEKAVDPDADKKGAETADADKKASEETPQSQKPDTAQPQLTPEQIVENQRAARAQAEDLLATQHYKFSDEEYEQYEEDPKTFLPKVAARIYMDATTNSMAHMMQLFPQMLEATLQARDNNAKYEGQFFDAWPKLKGHEAEVRRHAMVYRNMFPEADPETFIRNVGAQVMVALRLQPDEAAPNGQTQAQMQPHKPAAAMPPARTAAPDPNFYAELSTQEDVYDDD